MPRCGSLRCLTFLASCFSPIPISEILLREMEEGKRKKKIVFSGERARKKNAVTFAIERRFLGFVSFAISALAPARSFFELTCEVALIKVQVYVYIHL